MSWYDEFGVLRMGRRPGVANKHPLVSPGNTFGDWTVLSGAGSDKRGECLYLCRCKCGNEASVLSYHLRKGNSTKCNACSLAVCGPNSKLWNGCGEISGNYWDSIRRCSTRSKGCKRIKVFSITIEYVWNLFLEQHRRCALSNLPLKIDYGNREEHTASLDRKDSSIGYEPGNVQWVHKDINWMKNVFPQQKFISLCIAVANHFDRCSTSEADKAFDRWKFCQTTKVSGDRCEIL